MGEDRRLVDWDSVVAYYRKLDTASDSVRVETLGETTEGRPFLLATIASPQTLAQLDEYQRIQKQLVDPRATPPARAERLIAAGKSVVLVTCSIHSTEVASTMSAMEYVYRLLSEDTPKHRAILNDTILLLVPSLNPDGVDKVASWYRRWVGTEYEGAPMTELYHHYTGHDNNRDWYAFTQQETRLTVEKVHNVWHPQIVYDVHQMGTTGARMFVPPWTDPVDPNIDPLVLQQVNAFGAQMALDLTSSGKTGVVVNGIYDYFTPARHYQSYHGGLRLLSEAASVQYASPVTIPFDALQTQARGYNAQEPSWNFPEPWPGGQWRLRDIVDYQLVAYESVLYQAAIKRDGLLRNFYRIGRRSLAKQRPSAFVIPRRQHDPNALTRLLETLRFGLVEIQRAATGFSADGRRYEEGDYVIDLRQPFGPWAKTLLEEQRYPDLREYPGGPPRRPYDVTAHSLPLLMGVDVRESGERVRATLGVADQLRPSGLVDNALTLRLSPDASHSWIAVNRLLRDGYAVYRNERNGDFYLNASEAPRARLEELARALGVEFRATSEAALSHRRLHLPRIGLYAGHVPIMDEGWTRWLLEEYEFPYTQLTNERLHSGDLIREFDAIILPDSDGRTLHAGYIEGAAYRGAKVPPRYTGGIGDAGARALRSFAEAGGVVLAFNEASRYAIERLGINTVEDVLEGVSRDRFYAPGALLDTEVEFSHPLCFGMRPREAVWFEGGPVFRRSYDNPRGTPPTPVLRYPGGDVLASGWLLGEQYLTTRAAVMDQPVGDGHIVLFGIRPQYRGQPNATFKLVFNGLYYWR